MAKFLAMRIEKGKLTLDQVPDLYKEQVIEILVKDGFIVG